VFLPVPGLPGPPSPNDPARTQAFNIELDVLALQGLRELSESLMPGRPLTTTGDVARLVTKLHDTVDVFCRCFIPLREGYAQFVSSLDLQRSVAQRTMHRSRSAIALETATNAEAVVMALLDPQDHSFDAPQAVEGIFADLMLHQLALLDGVMQGVRALLDELSPPNIEAALAQRGTAGLFKSKDHARWSEFCERFERLSDERQAFAVIFGPSFAEVYRQYWRRKEGEDRGLPTGPPGR
jgi:type VI secretion system protein ImpI